MKNISDIINHDPSVIENGSVLKLRGEEFKDFSGLKNIKSVNLKNCTIGSLCGLEASEISYLKINECQIKDSNFNYNDKIFFLRLNKTNIDFNELYKLSALKILTLDEVDVKNLDWVINLTSLSVIIFYNCRHLTLFDLITIEQSKSIKRLIFESDDFKYDSHNNSTNIKTFVALLKKIYILKKL